MRTLSHDLRYALRGLTKRLGFSAVVVLTLALGIGPNAAIFSLIYGALLRPLPYHQPERLVQAAWQWQGGSTNALTATQFVYWAEHSRSFEATAAFARAGAGFNVVASGEPAYVRGQFVSADLFPVLGVSPALGRGLRPEEDRPGGPAVAIISNGLWRRSFGGDPDVLGRLIDLNGERHMVVGVMPPDFRFDAPSADVWLPLALDANPSDQGHNTLMVARLQPGISLQQAQADVARLMPAFREAFPEQGVSEAEPGIQLRSYRQELARDVGPTLLLLLGAVGLVLLIAISNAAALFFGRSAARSQEIAVRAALGGSRTALMRPLLFESAVLGLLGGGLGFVTAVWGLDALIVMLSPRDAALVGGAHLAWPILLGTSALALTVGLAAGAAPAIAASRADLRAALQGGDRSLGAVRQRARNLLVGAEVALSTVLLAGAVLMILSLSKLWNVAPGFQPDGVSVVQMSLPPEKYPAAEEIWRFESRVLERFAALPGVTSAASASNVPLERGLNDWVTGLEDGERVQTLVEARAVSPGYFETLSIPMVRGRSIRESDRNEAPPVVVVNQALARIYWPNRDPIGEQLWYHGMRTVVGVAGNVHELGLDEPPPNMVYLPQAQLPPGLATQINRWFLASWLIKTAAPIDLPTVRRAVAAVDPTQPVVSVRNLGDVIEASQAERRFVAALLHVFAGLAVLLAAVGVYGVVAYAVAQRRRELGLRAALGAVRRDLISLVLGQGLRLGAVGALVGLAGAALLTRSLRGLVFGVGPLNPLALLAAAGALAAVAVLASYIPARRATRVDPMVALRYE